MQNLNCKKCNIEIMIPDLTDEQKRELLEMKQAGLNIQVVQRIQDIAKLGLKNSKGLMEHINDTYGHCHRCNFQELDGENIICPKCKSVNTNWNYK